MAKLSSINKNERRKKLVQKNDGGSNTAKPEPPKADAKTDAPAGNGKNGKSKAAPKKDAPKTTVKKAKKIVKDEGEKKE